MKVLKAFVLCLIWSVDNSVYSQDLRTMVAVRSQLLSFNSDKFSSATQGYGFNYHPQFLSTLNLDGRLAIKRLMVGSSIGFSISNRYQSTSGAETLIPQVGSVSFEFGYNLYKYRSVWRIYPLVSYHLLVHSLQIKTGDTRNIALSQDSHLLEYGIGIDYSSALPSTQPTKNRFFTIGLKLGYSSQLGQRLNSNATYINPTVNPTLSYNGPFFAIYLGRLHVKPR